MIQGGLVLSLVMFTSQVAGEAIPENRKIDETLYPKAYGILASEPLMFPVDMSNWPVKIDQMHQLFVDDYLIASMANVERQVHQAVKHSANPLMVADKSWEGQGPVFPVVHRDEKTGRFQMWYAGQVRYTLASGVSARFPALYAESADGIHWEKPELGLHEYEGSKANNIVIPAGNLFGLRVDTGESAPSRRYKGIVWHEPPYVPREGYFLYTSPDGIHWTRKSQAPLAISLNGYAIPQNGIGDTSIFRWDDRLGKYVGDVKFVLPGKFRCRGMMESDDLIHWTPPRMTLYPDALDDPDSQVYGHLSFSYESMWIGLLRMMHTERTGWKQTMVELTASRDGRHWTRVGRREEFIPLGGPDEWDADYHEPTHRPIPMGDELWIYYRSARSSSRDPQAGDAIGLATLRRDGFVSLRAGDLPGHLTTRPLTCPGRRLYLNADIREGGWIQVALRTRDNEPLVTYSLDNAVVIEKGAVKLPVAWSQTQTIDLPADEHVRLHFVLKNALLYSFWFE